MTTESVPASSITARIACRSGASGVVRAEANLASPIRVSTVPMRPVLAPSPRSADSTRYAVVVLPLVPVMPIIRSADAA